MGTVLSQLRLAVQTLKSIASDYEVLSHRISQSPGIPKQNSSVPYWTHPSSPIAQHGHDTELPDYADIVIIGSGITGTSIAKALLEYKPGDGLKPLKVVMIEARDACSGATGRNGGHCSPNTFEDYLELRDTLGLAAATQIIQFRLAHISALINVATEEALLADCQARDVEEYNVYANKELFESAKDLLEKYLKDVPEEGKRYEIYETRGDIEELQLSAAISGCIRQSGAAIHPYRFVTGILSNLLSRYSNFQLFTQTPCTSISRNDNTYVVTTPRGDISTSHIIHATNAWSSHLLSGMRRKIVPTRLHMTAQRPGKGLTQSLWAGKRSFVFFPGKSEYAFDYLTQLLPSDQCHSDSKYPPTSGEFMFGGGAMLGGSAEAALFENIGNVDDERSELEVGAYLGGVLERYFSPWGKEGDSEDTSQPPSGSWGEGRMKALWTGIMGISADLKPWIGRIPTSISKRDEPRRAVGSSNEDNTNSHPRHLQLADPGEWIAAGFSGEVTTILSDYRETVEAS
ncbi:FAD dependent oxidoreductase [Pyrrhoderma noxium]|uniref:FAD dependent oxidoreductase n=1 Tax=Pyrrhoderma noxium TaxID=2282107 RepID=A0A286UIZ6_9AGAM|nr:FAD dependent oxidoreductase [Pyrrhoderma noxium]